MSSRWMISTLRRFVFCLIAAISGVAAAKDTNLPGSSTTNRNNTQKDDASAGFQPPYRNTSAVYRNTVSARSFNRNADLTYNPYYAMELELSPVWWLTGHLYTALNISMVRELTNSDITTKEGETLLQDIYLSFAAPDLFIIPKVKIHVTPAIRFYAPTSKISRARTLILSVYPRLRLHRTLDVLDGLTFAYVLGFRGNFHYSTTQALDEPLIVAPLGSTRSQESFANTGYRNTRFLLVNALALNLAIDHWIGISASAGVVHGFLYPITANDDRISYTPQTPTDVRYVMIYDGEVYVRPLPYLEVALGFTTQNFQLAADSTYEAPFFNRYTAAFLDLRVDVASFRDQFKPKRKRGKK